MAAGSRAEAQARAMLARRSPRWFATFAALFRRALRRDFHAVRLSRAGLPPAATTPRLVLYCNHPSWWDAAIVPVLVERFFPGRAGFAPMDEAMVARYGFMGRIGAFGVAQHTPRGAALFLAAAREVLSRPDNLLFITAQGHFADARERPVRLAPGVAHLAAQVPDATFVPLALDYTFWTERKPELLLRFGPAMHGRALQALPRDARAARLSEALEDVMDALAREAIARDPSAFTVLLSGAAGVGGVYDLWRRLRAAVRGERFQAAHGSEQL